MEEEFQKAMHPAVDGKEAKQLTRVKPQKIIYTGKSPKWYMAAKEVDVPDGIYRQNHVARKDSSTSSMADGEHEIKFRLGDDHFESTPIKAQHIQLESKETHLAPLQTVITIPTEAMDLHSGTIDQKMEYMRVARLMMREEYERQLVSHNKWGLEALTDPRAKFRVDEARSELCTDYLDQLLEVTWKDPSSTFILMHPTAIAQLSKEAMKDGSIIHTQMGPLGQEAEWRGRKVLPCDKIPLRDDGDGAFRTDVFAIRSGGDYAGYARLLKRNEKGEPVWIRKMHINQAGQAEYLISVYMAAVNHAMDGMAMLKDVRVGLLSNIE